MESKPLATAILRYLKKLPSEQHRLEDLGSQAELFRQEHTTRQHPFSTDDLLAALNLLQEQDRVEVSEQGDEICWKYIDERNAQIFSQMDFNERKIYRILQVANDEGASHIELRTNLNKDLQSSNELQHLTQAQVNALLKKMEKGGFVKAIKGQQQNRKKVYLLADVQPSVKITGGIMGQADPAQFEFLQSIMDRAYDYVCGQTHVTNRDLIIYMKSIGSSEELDIKALPDDDLQRLLQVLMYDERIELDQTTGYYRACNAHFPYGLVSFEDGTSQTKISFVETPCAHCSLTRQCSATDPAATVRPQRCLYMKIWEQQF